MRKIKGEEAGNMQLSAELASPTRSRRLLSSLYANRSFNCSTSVMFLVVHFDSEFSNKIFKQDFQTR